MLGSQTKLQRAQKKIGFWKPGGNPWQNFGRRGQEGLTPPRTPPGIRGATGRRLLGATRPLRAQYHFQIWQIGGNPWKNLGRQGSGMVDTGLHHPHPHPPTRLDVLRPHPLPHPAPSLVPPHPLVYPVSSQGSGSPKGREDSRLGPHQSRSLRQPLSPSVQTGWGKAMPRLPHSPLRPAEPRQWREWQTLLVLGPQGLWPAQAP